MTLPLRGSGETRREGCRASSTGERRGSDPGACRKRMSVRRFADLSATGITVTRRAFRWASGTRLSQAAAGDRGCEARSWLEDPAVHARRIARRARRVVLGHARLPLGVRERGRHGLGQSRKGPPKHNGRDDQSGHRGQSTNHTNVTRRQAALDADAQCVSKADFRSAAISCADRPSICQRSSMKATSPFLSRAMLGELGG